jgi:hypothetical protein
MSALLDVRLAEYEAELRTLWFKWIPALAAASLTVVMGAFWLILDLAELRVHVSDWWPWATVVATLIMYPAIYYLYPVRPTEQSIALDNLLGSIRQRTAKSSA